MLSKFRINKNTLKSLMADVFSAQQEILYTVSPVKLQKRLHINVFFLMRVRVRCDFIDFNVILHYWWKNIRHVIVFIYIYWCDTVVQRLPQG